ncbi:DUF2497 domain-containing protein [Acetobacteraceae bacterium KSS8]|uniref:DUF2497 domain-containing protein n=1 Tax=Endosaccharibacter trunci TaxID=2812733 RepID=A0ABT1W6K8_9PROT|nr:DUF2497 domain-containing protein [Acetobacteraceae bacterium KSS8]
MPDASRQSPPDEQDASMDTILASIRRIIMEDEAGAQGGDGAGKDADDELMVLQPSMIVETSAHAMPEPSPGPLSMTTPERNAALSAADLAAALFDDPEPPPSKPVPAPVAVAPPPVAPEPVLESVPVPVVAVAPPPSAAVPAEPPVAETPFVEPVAAEPLLAPAASLAAAQALASLEEAMRPEPPPPAGPRLLRSGGPTLEDMVREELRVQVKDWLDANLPALVERLVAQEIGRLVKRG